MTELLTDALRTRLGETVTYRAPEALSSATIRYYALAVGDANPIYTDEAAAQAAGLPGTVAPPTLICDSNQYLPGPRDHEGFMGHSWGIEIPNTRLVRGGNDYTFHRYARPDDVLTVTWTLTDMTERVTSSGVAMLIITSEARYSAADGEPITTNVETLIYTALPTKEDAA